jgi:hypothetical protein
VDVSLFKKREFAPAGPAAKRAAMLPTHDLVPWAETCLYEVGRNLTEFQRSQDPTALAEANQAVAVLGAVMGEINARSGESVVGQLGHP